MALASDSIINNLKTIISLANESPQLQQLTRETLDQTNDFFAYMLTFLDAREESLKLKAEILTLKKEKAQINQSLEQLRPRIREADEEKERLAKKYADQDRKLNEIRRCVGEGNSYSSGAFTAIKAIVSS